MFPALFILGPVVAPLIVAVLVFIVIAAIAGTTVAAATDLSASFRVAIAFLIGGLAAAKAHSWARGQVDMAMHRGTQYNSLANTQESVYTSPPKSSTTTALSSGGLPPVNIPAHLMPS